MGRDQNRRLASFSRIGKIEEPEKYRLTPQEPCDRCARDERAACDAYDYDGCEPSNGDSVNEEHRFNNKTCSLIANEKQVLEQG